MKCLDRRKKKGKGHLLGLDYKNVVRVLKRFSIHGCNGSKVVVKPL